jgi:hypothetical protein
MKPAVVTFKTPTGRSMVGLPVKECTDLGSALLAEPRDEEKMKDAMFNFGTKVTADRVRLSD